jgi:hypothetical protein
VKKKVAHETSIDPENAAKRADLRAWIARERSSREHAIRFAENAAEWAERLAAAGAEWGRKRAAETGEPIDEAWLAVWQEKTRADFCEAWRANLKPATAARDRLEQGLARATRRSPPFKLRDKERYRYLPAAVRAVKQLLIRRETPGPTIPLQLAAFLALYVVIAERGDAPTVNPFSATAGADALNARLNSTIANATPGDPHLRAVQIVARMAGVSASTVDRTIALEHAAPRARADGRRWRGEGPRNRRKI